MSNTYGRRYPGGHSVIDRGVFDDETLWSREIGTKKRNKTNKSTKQAQRTKQKPSVSGGCCYEKLIKGTRVHHVTLGDGTILSRDDRRVFVKFDKAKSPQPLKKRTAKKNLEIIDKKSSRRVSSSAQTTNTPKNISWKDCADDFVGCQVRDKWRKTCIVIKINGSKMTVRSLIKNSEQDYIYPDDLLNGSLVISEEPNLDAAMVRQQKAHAAFTRTMESQK